MITTFNLLSSCILTTLCILKKQHFLCWMEIWERWKVIYKSLGGLKAKVSAAQSQLIGVSGNPPPLTERWCLTFPLGNTINNQRTNANSTTESLLQPEKQVRTFTSGFFWTLWMGDVWALLLCDDEDSDEDIYLIKFSFISVTSIPRGLRSPETSLWARHFC